MYYIEFFERRPEVPHDRFQEVIQACTARWASEHPDDRPILCIGRTWRLGPRPGNLVVWKIDGWETFERWTAEFRTERGLANHSEFQSVATIVEAGVYDEIGSEII